MTKPAATVRGRKGHQTRERLLGAAIAEFRRAGMAAAEIGPIVSAAGVAHGTFFFHFPTKEHVLIELERREEDRMATELTRIYAEPHDVRTTLTQAVAALQKLKSRLGRHLFKDFLALHFSSTRPPTDEWTTHPLIVAVVEDLQHARDRGEIPADVDVMHNGISFLVGLYALLITIPEPIREPFLDEYLDTYLRGLRVLA
ncbi:TetR/AcrR family transcriptional regulator [Mycolicibacterium fallax]|uniref:TetR family transcriptional regulator n=1 Tax=Mycolicibacterium fallax TaxID=1793 RepID=A0A1X1RCS2_MYCFA|nr:TetR/AcrR family transcriptional regulator [Mycolicibacterium fallax]ORV03120.1 TetR family transcriptional regulator [Mycolicibacterium fallax]BBY98881.1 TetR family transcriptional regulator [Mycolicibacterium fallax]HOW93011.1 TetR/AcrR family transcriptional regulator [Mycolicibacterium fallax]HSA39372.1 TetR/AcrR family transcriptional regulator [Mycobacterium sp.]